MIHFKMFKIIHFQPDKVTFKLNKLNTIKLLIGGLQLFAGLF